MNELIIRNIEKTKKALFNVITQFFNDVRSKYNLVPTSNPSGVIHKLKNKLNKIIKLLVLTNYSIMNPIKVKNYGKQLLPFLLAIKIKNYGKQLLPFLLAIKYILENK